MTDTPATPAAAPAMTLAEIVGMIRNALASVPEPAHTQIDNGLRWLEPAIEFEIDGAIMALARKVPVAGTFIGGVVVKSVNVALEQGLVAVIGPIA